MGSQFGLCASNATHMWARACGHVGHVGSAGTHGNESPSSSVWHFGMLGPASAAAWIVVIVTLLIGFGTLAWRCMKKPADAASDHAQPPQLVCPSLPYIARSEFHIDRGVVLGQGKFGIVFRGKFGKMALTVDVKPIDPGRQRLRRNEPSTRFTCGSDSNFKACVALAKGGGMFCHCIRFFVDNQQQFHGFGYKGLAPRRCISDYEYRKHHGWSSTCNSNSDPCPCECGRRRRSDGNPLLFLKLATNWGRVSGVGVGILLLAVVLYLCCRCKSRRNAVRSLNLDSLDEDPGLPVDMPLMALEPLEPLTQTEVEISRFPQIAMTEFEIDRSRVLGSGKGGIVYKGAFGNRPVAVKTLNPNCVRVDMYMASLNQEVEIFRTLPPHPNIIRGLAYSYADATATVPNIRTGTGYIIMELCSLGSLREFLLRGPYREPAAAAARSHGQGQGYISTAQANQLAAGGGYNDSDLLQFAQQISTGAEFLAEQRVVHGDLACRNVLLHAHPGDGERRAIINDFGLARKLDKDSPIYIKARQELVPWKWAAPEVLSRNEYSLESDVWSFGVLLWELYSRGEEPYTEIHACPPSFVQELYQGSRRLPKPGLASVGLYRLMKKCWESEPCTRITSTEIRSQLERL